MHVSRTCVKVTHKGCKMLESSWALEWMCCSRGRWKVACLVVWEGMYVSRYSARQERYTIFYIRFVCGDVLCSLEKSCRPGYGLEILSVE